MCLMKIGLSCGSVQTGGPEGQTFSPPTVEDLGKLFPQLEVVELIGKGGMGAVYKARQKDLDRLVALKVLPAQAGADPGFTERFTREARALAKLNHPNIVAVYEFGQAQDLHYFIMEYVDGTNLRQVERSGGLEPRQALAIIPQICEALQFAHDKGVVHRDIKPENILIDREGRVKIADFGLAKILGRTQDLTLTQEGHVMGTPHYMAPEQVEHPQAVDHRADIYSLGVVFYEMLTGELPMGKFAPPSRKVQIDVRLDEVVLRTLAKEPDRRYQQASQVKTEVETIAGTSRPSPIANQGGVEYRSKRTLWGLPLVHVATGIDPDTGHKRVARGIIAIGDVAQGVVAFGGAAFGGIAFGGLAIGVIAFGGAGLGLLALGGLAVGFLAALGGGAIGTVALGGGAIGYYAYGGGAWGAHVVSGTLQDPAALAFFDPWSTTLMQARMLWIEIAAFSAAMVVGIGVPIIVRSRLERGRRAPERRSAWIFGLFLPLIILLIVFLNLKPRANQGSGPFSQVRSTTLFEKGSADVDCPLTGPYVALLPQGTVEMVGVSEHPSADQTWWTADGLPYQGRPLFTWGSHSFANQDQMAREFVIRLSGLPEDASWPIWRLDPVAGWAGGGVGFEPNQGAPDLKMVSATLPSSARNVTLKVGVGMGPWETVAEGDIDSTGMSSTSRYGQNWTVSFLKAGEADGGTKTTVIHTVKDWEVRVVAVDIHGLEHTTGHSEGQGTDAFSEKTATFTDLPLVQVQAFRFQVRPYQWVEFRNVSLNPGHKTRVGIVHAVGAPPYTAPPAGPGPSSQAPSLSPAIGRMELDLEGETMPSIVTALRQRYPVRLCLENLDFDKERDGNTIEQVVAQLEGTAKNRPLTDKEKPRLSMARQLLQEGRPKEMLFDCGPRYEGRITADTVEAFLARLTRDTPYDWRRIDDTYVVCPRGPSRLMYPVTLKTDGLTVEQAVGKVLDQNTSGYKMGLSVTIAMLVKEIGEDPCPWLRAKAPPLNLHEVPAMTALCRITAGARPELVWGLYGYRDGRHMQLTPVSKPK